MTVFESMTPEQRSLRARLASHSSWGHAQDRKARSQPGRDAAWKHWEDKVDPDRKLSPEDLFKAAESARRAHLSAAAYKSVAARRKKAAGNTK